MAVERRELAPDDWTAGGEGPAGDGPRRGDTAARGLTHDRRDERDARLIDLVQTAAMEGGEETRRRKPVC